MIDFRNFITATNPNALRTILITAGPKGVGSLRLVRVLLLTRLKSVNAHKTQGVFLIERLSGAFLHVANEILFEQHLGPMYPAALSGPGHVTWWNLW